MRYRLVALTLLFLLPVMNPFTAPAPDRSYANLDIQPPKHQWDDARLMDLVRPYAILDIGPPPKGKTAEEHCKEQIGYLTAKVSMVFQVWCEPEVQKLPLFQSVKFLTGEDFDPWLEKTIQVTPEKGGRRLRLTSRAGDSAEQAVIINALLRIYVRDYVSRRMKGMETILRRCEETASRDAKLIREETDPLTRMRYQQQHVETKTRNAGFRDEITRLKRVAVIQWAK